MVGIAHLLAQWPEQQHHQRHKDECHAAHGDERGGVDALRVLVLFVGETEVGGLHAEGEQHHHQGGVGIDVGNDTIAAGGSWNLGGVEGHQQVVQKAADDAGQTIDGRVLGQR